MLDKSKIEKVGILLITTLFLGMICYDWYLSKNKIDAKGGSVIVNQVDNSEKSDNLKKTKLKENKKIKKTARKSDKKVHKRPKLININTASVSELTNGLRGIGESKARLIVLYRQKKGNFSNIEEIKNIKGIGEKTFNNLSRYITV